MVEKNRIDMTLLELLDEYKRRKANLNNYRDTVFMKDVDEKDEVTKKRHIKEYDEIRQEILEVACFIAEKLLK